MEQFRESFGIDNPDEISAEPPAPDFQKMRWGGVKRTKGKTMGDAWCHGARGGRTRRRMARTSPVKIGKYRVTRPRERRVSGDTRSSTVLKLWKPERMMLDFTGRRSAVPLEGILSEGLVKKCREQM